MFILTDGKNYVMENPMKSGDYLSTTSPVQAKEFNFKQARALIRNKKKSLSWIKKYYVLNKETGNIEESIPTFSNAGVFCDDKSFDFNYGIVEEINKEVDSFVGLAAWDTNQLTTYRSMLIQGLQFYDSAISDIQHARMDKRPPAHIRTKIDGILNGLEEKRRDIKQATIFVDVFIEAIKQQWTIGKIKAELSKAKYVPYKGRTKYYNLAIDLLKDY